MKTSHSHDDKYGYGLVSLAALRIHLNNKHPAAGTYHDLQYSSHASLTEQHRDDHETTACTAEMAAGEPPVIGTEGRTAEGVLWVALRTIQADPAASQMSYSRQVSLILRALAENGFEVTDVLHDTEAANEEKL